MNASQTQVFNSTLDFRFPGDIVISFADRSQALQEFDRDFFAFDFGKFKCRFENLAGVSVHICMLANELEQIQPIPPLPAPCTSA